MAMILKSQFKPIPRPVNAPIYAEYTTTKADERSYKKYQSLRLKPPAILLSLIARIAIPIAALIVIIVSIFTALSWPFIDDYRKYGIDPSPMLWKIWTPFLLTLLTAAAAILYTCYSQGILRLVKIKPQVRYFACSNAGIITGTATGFQTTPWDKVIAINEDEHYFYITLTHLADMAVGLLTTNQFSGNQRDLVLKSLFLSNSANTLGFGIPKRVFNDPDLIYPLMQDLHSSAQQIDAEWSLGLSEPVASVTAPQNMLDFARLVAYSRFWVTGSKALILKIGAVGMLAAGILSQVLIFRMSFVVPSKLINLSSGLVVFGVCSVWKLFVSPSRNQTQFDTTPLEPITVSVHSECLTVEKRGVVNAYAWFTLTNVIRDQSDIMIWINKNPTVIIPKITFSSETRYTQFSEIIEAAWKGKLDSLDPLVAKEWPPAPKIGD